MTKMGLKHLFIINPLGKLNLKIDTSMNLAFALNAMGMKPFMALQTDLYARASEVRVKASPLHFGQDVTQLAAGEQEDLGLSEFASVQMRQ